MLSLRALIAGRSAVTRAAPAAAAALTTARRTKVTWTATPPSTETHHLVGYHGTTTKNLSAIQAEGFKPAKTGENFGRGSQAGKGVYATTSMESAKLFAAQSAGESTSAGRVASLWLSKDAPAVRATMPSAAFYKPQLYTAFHEEHTEAHEMSLGPTKVPHAGKRDTGTTTLLTQRALDDQNVEYLGHAGPEMQRTEVAQILADLPADTAKKWAHMRKTGRKKPP